MGSVDAHDDFFSRDEVGRVLGGKEIFRGKVGGIELKGSDSLDSDSLAAGTG